MRPIRRSLLAFPVALGVLMALPAAMAQTELIDEASLPTNDIATLPEGSAEEIVDELAGDGQAAPAPAPNPGDGGDLGAGAQDAVSGQWLLAGAVALGLTSLGAVAFFLANRYVDPREALQNQSRSMLYGHVKSNPGVHLKQLSSEFDMKTSTVLWHVRKLEHADLVRSRKSNGFRVFYPVSGGLEAKQMSTAITALSNDNARRIFEAVAVGPGAEQRHLADGLEINPGTVRWHIKKLRQAGLLAELSPDRTGRYFATEMGIKAMRKVAGLPDDIRAPVLDFSEMGMTAN